MAILDVRSIVKEFGRVRAIDRLSFSIEQGEIFALLGPNGAGKTTTIRTLLGIIRPDEGEIDFTLGGRSRSQASTSLTGYLPEERGLYRDVPTIRTLAYMGVLRGLDQREAVRRAGRWLERVGLADRGKDKLDTLSKGNQQKVQFISAVLHEPEFAVLDEPFSGLDPLNQELFIDIIRELRANGMTVLLSAHQMPLVERLADRVLLMNRGREVESGRVEEIRQRSESGQKVLLWFAEPADISRLERLPQVQRVEKRGPGEFVFFMKRGVAPQSFLVEAASTDGLLEIHTERVSLHEIFVQAVSADRGAAEEGAES